MKKIFCAFLVLLLASAAFAQNFSIERYLNIRSAGSPTFSPDGKRIAFLTNITGTSQIWMIDSTGGYPEQITSFQDNIGFVRWSPAGNGILFGKASGGDENTQLFWMSNDGAEIKQLTSNPKVRHNFGSWSADGTKIYYASNKRDRNFFDIYSMEVESGKEELLYQQDGSNAFLDASDDGKRIIVGRSSEKFSLDNDLYLIELSTKEITHLTPHAEAAQYSDVHFLPDNRTIALGTNQNGEFYNLAEISLKVPNIATVTELANKIRVIDNSNWDLDASEVAPDGSLYAYTLNREGFSELYVRKIETGGKPLISGIDKKAEMIKLPAQGIVGGLEFSKDGDKLAFTFNSAKYNSDIWIYDLQSKNLMQLTKSSRSGIPQSSFVEPQLIKFKSFDGREISAWYYKPEQLVAKGDKTTISVGQAQNLPVIVSVHGGPEGQDRPGFNSLTQYYLSRGYAVLAPNVRGSTGYGKTFSHLDDVEKREDSVKDLAYAVEWLKTQGGADAKRIAVTGGSYGGYMTLAAITLYPDLWAAAVDTVGIVNWETFLKNTSGYRRRQREVEYGMLDKDIEFLRRISPIAKIDKIKTPLFVIHGKNDPRVPYTEAEQVVKALRDRGAIVEYKLYDDEGHGISKLKNRLELYPLVADFLDKYMK
jgi:dipeptidyl aminopeptidase/acylaminoacyl peptidase